MNIRTVIGLWTAICLAAGVILVVRYSQAWGGLLAAAGIAGLVTLWANPTDDREFYHQFSQALTRQTAVDRPETGPVTRSAEGSGKSSGFELPTPFVQP